VAQPMACVWGVTFLQIIRDGAESSRNDTLLLQNE